ncbi:acyl carrier protein [Clostridium argentinense]|uniref:acyl carrier protein n=1 Tax=Clostridium argentinense TaxID=29341 RepID=UPI0009B7CF20|nr:acyl carrier protein [Clostridium argentinense]ARC83363.1 acyl carrier protein [Clostridium argentinense]NFF39195.1 acyl carrier protein [Clostridium argentinense]NFP49607.1 acyl carrier protein [Clostridium argentinense]NFP72310.1 acyl carrier protein [Clostridium argentinense]NFP76481.1 acyl carrier protein [Clostridium argentinense]
MVFEKVKKIIADQLGLEEAEVALNSTFNDDLGVDSLELFEVIISLEEEFNIEIPNEEIEDIKDVKGIVDYIEKKINN